MVTIAIVAMLLTTDTVAGKGRTQVATGGGAVAHNIPDPPPGPPDRNPTAHNHTFGFDLSKAGGSYSLNLRYVDSHDNVPSGPDGQFMLKAVGVTPSRVVVVPGSFVYFEAAVSRQGPAGGRGGPGPAANICAWAEDGASDRFKLSDRGGYSSGPPGCLCPDPNPSSFLTSPGPPLAGGNITVR